jgi:hypothetical protein
LIGEYIEILPILTLEGGKIKPLPPINP